MEEVSSLWSVGGYNANSYEWKLNPKCASVSCSLQNSSRSVFVHWRV